METNTNNEVALLWELFPDKQTHWDVEWWKSHGGDEIWQAAQKKAGVLKSYCDLVILPKDEAQYYLALAQMCPGQCPLRLERW